MNHKDYMKKKKLCRKNLNPVEEKLDDCVFTISCESDSDTGVIEAVKNLLETIQECNQYKMYYVRDLAIDRAIRRCEYELDFAKIDPTLSEADIEKAAEALRKKHFGYLS